MSVDNRPLLMRANRNLGAALVELNLIKIEDLETANGKLIEHLDGTDRRRCSVLAILANDLQVITEEELLTHIVENEGLGLMDLSVYDVPEDIRKTIDPGEAWATWTVPIDREDDTHLVASAYYLSPAVRSYWEKRLTGKVLWYATSLEGIADFLEKLTKKAS